MVSIEAYRTPSTLTVTRLTLRRALVIGQCTAGGLLKFLGDAVSENIVFSTLEHIFFSNFSNIPDPEYPIEDYDFQMLVPPLRSIVPDIDFMQRDDTTEDAAQVSFDEAAERISLFFQYGMRLNREHGLLTFTSNFVVPQQDSVGRLYRRYDLRNVAYFIEELNKKLYEEANIYKNSFVIDAEKVSSTVGKQYFLDDVTNAYNHNGVIADGSAQEWDNGRIETPRTMDETYTIRGVSYLTALGREVGAMYRTIRQIDQVKLIVVDLDDTLWRGITAEGHFHIIPDEGWPHGLAEALLILKRRGIMLAISSKNTEEVVRGFWEKTFHGRLQFADFVSIKINWEPKVANMELILSEVNVLPESVVFIDDNPVERAAMIAAFPAIRVLGEDLYQIRRVLLNAPETQTAMMTDESSQRTAMVQGQIKRDASRSALSREEFLASLNVKVTFEVISVGSPKFDRALELINKTNQFNTTGLRRRSDELLNLLQNGAILLSFDVEDRFSRYGTVGILIISGDIVEQFVMSCRVFGLGVEFAALSKVSAMLPAGFRARLIHTERNQPCRDVYRAAGCVEENGVWISRRPVELPPHLTSRWLEAPPINRKS